MPGAVAATDANGTQFFVNPAFCRLVGMSEAELLGMGPPYTYWAADDAPAIYEQFKRMHSRERPEAGEFALHFVHKNGERFPVRVRAAPLGDDDGAVRGWVASVEDLRPIAEVKESLREREHFIETVTRAAPEIIYVYDLRDHRLVYANRNIAETLGFTAQEVIALGPQTPPPLLHPDDCKRLPELYARWDTVKDGQILESQYRLRAADGQYRWFLGRDTVFQRDERGAVAQIIGVAQDISVWKHAEDARDETERHLRDSESRYRLLADHATDMISRHSSTGSYRDVSPACVRLLGFTPHELIGRSIYELVHPADRDKVFHFHVMIIEEKKPQTIGYRSRRKNDAFIWIETHAQPILDPATGEVVEVLAVTRDITDRKNAEDSLRQSEELFRALVEKSSDGIAIVEPDDRIRYLSPAANRILGYEQVDMIGKNVREMLVPEDRIDFTRRFRAAVEAPGGSAASTLRARARDGSIRHLEITVTNYVGDPSIAGYIINFRDVSDRLVLEEQLRQAQKMEAINQLAGGIAHDFNNILTAIMGNVAVLLEAFPAGDAHLELLSAIEKAAQRAAHLTNRLLVYSRRSTVHLRPTDVNRMVRDTVALLRPTFDPRIVFDFSADPDVWPIMADADQIEQVITNVCLNSRDAMPRGGRLSLASANVTVAADFPTPPGASKPADYVRLTVADTGCGMTPEVRVHVFEPFFTTKPTGSGTGLGLAMVYGIVKSHGGWVNCESIPGAGTRMAIYLPRAVQSEEPAIQPDRFSPSRTLKATGETVLLVDDEPAIRTLGRHILEKSGYRVLLAEDGIDAIETFGEVANQVALVILDMTMPRMSGPDTFRHLREIKPDVGVLFSSGYSPEHLDLANLGAGFIGKPYRPAELLEAVRAQINRDRLVR